jgi:hypothetical protein
VPDADAAVPAYPAGAVAVGGDRVRASFYHGRRGRGARMSPAMFVVHATRKLLTRVGKPDLDVGERSTTVLGDWYATVLFWRPQVALFVDESTLLPVLMPLAPAATVTERFPPALSAVLAAHQVSRHFIDAELAQMADCQLATTSNRSVLGIMNEFTHLADTYRAPGREPNLIDLAVRLAATPCSPLYRRHVSPDRELAARTAEHAR